MKHAKKIYADRLNVLSFLRFLCLFEGRCLLVLEDFNRWQRGFAGFLNLFGFDIRPAIFYVSDLRDEDGGDIYFSVLRSATPLSIEYAQEMVAKSPSLSRANVDFGIDNIVLHLARKIFYPIQDPLKYGRTARALHGEDGAVIICMESALFNSRLVTKQITNVRWVFYGRSTLLIRYCFHAVIVVLKGIKRLIIPRLRQPIHQFNPDTTKPAVLMLEEESINYDGAKRSQFDWHIGQDNIAFNTILLRHFGQTTPIADLEAMTARDIFILEAARYRQAKAIGRHCKKTAAAIAALNRCQRSILWELITSSPKKSWGLISVLFLLEHTKHMLCFMATYNIKAMLICELYFDHSDACHLAGHLSGAKIFARQYSALSMKTPHIMSTGDYFFIFAEHFKDTFSHQTKPSYQPLVSGYSKTYKNPKIAKRAKAQRQDFKAKGIDFVIALFDETIEYHKWGWVNPQNHRQKMTKILEFLKTRPHVGLLVKTQFVRNLPSVIYPNDAVLNALKKSGQYVELISGTHRNIILPCEAALAADICIGHKAGATASLEAALCGTRSILLDSFNTKSDRDAIFARANIVFESLEAALEGIDEVIKNPHSTVGDWSGIVDELSAPEDKSVEIAEVLGKAVQS